MAAAAEQLEQEYGHSLSTLRELGSFAVSKTRSCEEQRKVEDLAYDDFETAISEMLKTDHQFRAELDVENINAHEVKEGLTRANDGTPMLEMLRRAAEVSRQMAEQEPGYAHQASRDKCDELVAQKVDKLEPGQSFLGVSFDPKEAMQQYPHIYKEKLGYREGLIYIQIHSKINDHTLVSGSLSIDKSNAKALREVLHQHNIEIPEDITDDTWLMSGQVLTASHEEILNLARQIKADYYQKIGETHRRLSINQYVQENHLLVRQLFTVYYRALAEALYTGHNNQVLQGLASSLLNKDLSNMKADIRRQLIRVANSPSISKEDGRTVDSIVRYAVVEQLRKGLGSYIISAPTQSHLTPRFYQAPMPIEYLNNMNNAHELVADNVQAGVSARRDYGGCAGQIELSLSPDNNQSSSLQEAFGGINGKDNYGSRKFKCSNGHLNIRPYNELIDACQHKGCKAKVTCR